MKISLLELFCAFVGIFTDFKLATLFVIQFQFLKLLFPHLALKISLSGSPTKRLALHRRLAAVVAASGELQSFLD